MDIRPWSATRPGSQDLSKAPGFLLGALDVAPSLRTISAGGRLRILEPRVMQVLVALAQAEGAVLSREDLIGLCWDGRIVGDNAINRVISQLRHALAELAGSSVRLETITKVGFRLVADDCTRQSDRGPPPSEPVRTESALTATIGRRGLVMAGAAAATFGASGFVLWRQARPPRPHPRAAALVRNADLMVKSGLPGSTRQALRELEQAVEIDPAYATAWGRLAGTYRHVLDGFSRGELQSYHRMVDSAAGRALELDPRQPDARLALVLKRPFLGQWAPIEQHLRNLQEEFPNHWYVNGQLSLLLMDVGRADDALIYRRRVINADPAIPVAWGFLALNYLAAGRFHEAGSALDRAMRRWSGHAFLWFVQFQILLETGRPLEAAAFARDMRYLPDGLPPDMASEKANLAAAIASGERMETAKARDVLIGEMTDPRSALAGAPALALLGESNLALAATSAFLFGGSFVGHDWPVPGPFDVRSTAFLFQPSLLDLRDRPAYAAILRGSGLESYWKESGSQPDFRRG